MSAAANISSGKIYAEVLKNLTSNSCWSVSSCATFLFNMIVRFISLCWIEISHSFFIRASVLFNLFASLSAYSMNFTSDGIIFSRLIVQIWNFDHDFDRMMYQCHSFLSIANAVFLQHFLSVSGFPSHHLSFSISLTILNRKTRTLKALFMIFYDFNNLFFRF